MMVVHTLGGEAIATITKAVVQGAAPGAPSPELQAASVTAARALLVGTLISLPILMAVCYAPLLAYFHDAGALAAMKSSLVACAKNAGAMFVWGGVIVFGMFLAMPLARALHQYDLAAWVLAPIVLPSLYASYKDIFLAGAREESEPPVAEL
jgi:hypothetical protein